MNATRHQQTRGTLSNHRHVRLALLLIGWLIVTIFSPRAWVAVAQSAAAEADWTIMVYMNGDNNLKPFAMMNFKQMASVGSTDRVNIVVQFDSIAKYDFTPPVWAQTLRFYMRPRGQNAQPTRAIPDDALKIADGGIDEEADMGTGVTLSKFVEWAATKYRAKKYALIIWDHGQGYRADPAGNQVMAFRSSTLSPFRTVSNDETNHSQLYVRDIQNSLDASLGRLVSQGVLQQPKLSLLGFDACLMAMVETAYAMRKAGDVMVGSQDLEPGEGWRYDDWLAQLTAHPEMDAPSLGRALVQSYRKIYGDPASPASIPETTLSAIDLSKTETLAQSISVFAKSLSDNFATLYPQIKAAREASPVYAPNAYRDGKEYFYHIDLGKFVDELASRVSDPSVSKNATNVKTALQAGVIDHYAGTTRVPYGSNGLCIYFPASLLIYRRDRFAENGYEKSNTKWPVQFVQDTSWPDFLHTYYTKAVQ
jgi:Clostripain family